MKYTIRTIVLLSVLIAGLPAAGFGQRLPGQAVTYADFNYINDIAASMSRAYFATSSGIIRYDYTRRRWDTPMTGAVGLEGTDVYRVWVNTFDDKLYARTDDGDFEYNSLFDTWSYVDEIPDLRTNSRHLAVPNTMFPPFGYNYSAGGFLIDPFGRSFRITDILDDGTGSVWIGTWGYGAATASSVTDVMKLIPYGLLQDQVDVILEDDSILWVTGRIQNSYRTGISGFNRNDSGFVYIESGITNDFPAVDIACLAADSQAIYIGTAIGLLVYDRQLNRVTDQMNRRSGLTDDEVTSLELIGDTLYVGTAGGLTLLDFMADSVLYVNPGEFINQTIYAIKRLNDFVWIAASSGAYRLSLKTGKLQRYQDPKMVLFNEVYSIAVYEDEVWFASDGGVVMLNTATGEAQEFPLQSALFRPRALAANSDIAAVGSDRGFTLLFRGERMPYSREFSIDDGLPSTYVNALLLDGDYLWVGSDRGLTRFWWNNPQRVD